MDVVDCRFCEAAQQAETADRWPVSIACESCGNKRCPHATYHEHDCTRSNEPGQRGSGYGDVRCGEPGCACITVADKNDAGRAEYERLLATGMTRVQAMVTLLG